MNPKTLKLQRDLKSKLMAAISMLLVSSILLVTSTYAWFTLSTAPEVTGITTAVGANGNLEMALLPEDGKTDSIASNVGDSVKAVAARNITWGNLVDLSGNETYGMDKITLYPSELTVATKDTEGNPLTLDASLLSTPQFGADGRISQLAKNTVTSTFDKTEKNFPTNDLYGVRAVGVASGMTDRQLAYRNARSAANTAMNTAVTKASQSLNNNGSSLANIALKKATDDDGTATYTQEDVASLQQIVTDLVGTTVTWDESGNVTSISKDSALGQIEQAYINYIYAIAVSEKGVEEDANDTNETKFKAVKAIVEKEGATLNSIISEISSYYTLPDTITVPVNKLNATILSVATAQKELKALESSGDSISWDDINDPLYKLANTDKMLIAGYEASEVKDKMSEIINKVAGSGLTITIATGGGVYADIADHCGDYSASVTIETVQYGTLTLNNMNAVMKTETTVNPVYLSVLGAAVTTAGAPKSAEGTSLPITDMYGYVIDLAFRTNAAESNLLLQQEGVDRIYDENGNEETMGNGSTMTFKATTTDFDDKQVKSLMDAVRIVFFQKGETNKVLATAKLDTTTAELGVNGWTAEMYLYTVSAGGEIVYDAVAYDAAATDVTYYTKTAGTAAEYTAISDSNPYTEGTKVFTLDSSTGTYTEATYDATATDVTYFVLTKAATEDTYEVFTGTYTEGTTVYIKKTTTAGENVKTDDVITALTQNEATQVSVLVYLDGNYVGNKDVAATAATSVTGSMNLQFASSANLVPMEYADLHLPSTATTYNVTVPTGATGDASATAGKDYTFTVDTTNYTLGTVTVGGTAVTPTDNGSGSYTIPAASVTGDIVINVTAATTQG